MGKEYYWMTGAFINDDKGEDTDIWALENGYISVVPTHFDLTAHHHIQKLNSWDLLKKISPGLLGWLIGLAIPFGMLLLLVEFSADGNALDTIPSLCIR
ncbi:MAG: hypothetical protein CM15mP83_3930 [Flavobacteriaceae bacterium]|nr:MAG: hypothetical protein CM15mP83_3930 [Flavobacteriaceae bacterium]